MTDNTGADKIINNVFISLIVVTVIFIAIVAITGLKIGRGVQCGVQTFDEPIVNPLIESPFSLTSTNYVVQEDIYVDNPDMLYYDLCLSANATSNKALKISVLDGINGTKQMGYLYFNPGLSKQCIEVAKDDIDRHNDFNLECSNCDGNDYLTLMQEYQGIEKQIVTSTTNSINVTKSNRLAMTLKAGQSCKEDLHFFTKLYFFFVVCMGIVLLILVGYKSFYKHVVEDFKK